MPPGAEGPLGPRSSRTAEEEQPMKLVILDTAEAIAERAADAIEDLLTSKPAAVLGTRRRPAARGLLCQGIPT